MSNPSSSDSGAGRGARKRIRLVRRAFVALAMVTVVGCVVLALFPPWGRIKARTRQAEWRALNTSEFAIHAGDEQVFGFDGSGNRVFVPDAPELDLGTNQDFAVECWIKPYPACSKFALQTRAWFLAHPKVVLFLPRRFTAWLDTHWRNNDFGVSSIVAKNQTTSILEAVGFQFHLHEGHLACQLAQAPMRPLTFENFVSKGPDLLDRRWHHVAMSVQRNSPTGGKLYADGAAVLTFDPTKQAGSLSVTEPLRVGDHANPSLRCYFKGQIGGVVFYRRSLSAEEIAERCRAGRPKR